MFENLQEKITELDNQRKQLNSQLFTTIQKEIVSVLNKYPELIGIRWTQYVPRFNDGSRCTFSLEDPDYISSKKLSEEELDNNESAIEIQENYYPLYELGCRWDSTTKKYIYSNSAEKEKTIILDEIASALYTVADLLEEQFGSNAEVIVTKEEIIVNDYNCGF